MQTRHTRHPGFTLIELLVVVSIIGLLIALLVPALSQAHGTANATLCLSNQKQTATALVNYSTEHQGRLVPYAIDSPDGQGRQWWFGYQQGKSTGMGRPLDKTRGPLAQYLGDEIHEALSCPAFPATAPNYRAKFNQRSAHFGLNGALSPPFANTPAHRIDDVDQPSAVFAFADAVHQQMQPYFFEPHSVSYRRPRMTTGTGHYRHSQRANTVYLDAHAEPIDVPEGETVWQRINDAPLANLDTSDGPGTRYGLKTWTAPKQHPSE